MRIFSKGLSLEIIFLSKRFLSVLSHKLKPVKLFHRKEKDYGLKDRNFRNCQFLQISDDVIL